MGRIRLKLPRNKAPLPSHLLLLLLVILWVDFCHPFTPPGAVTAFIHQHKAQAASSIIRPAAGQQVPRQALLAGRGDFTQFGLVRRAVDVGSGNEGKSRSYAHKGWPALSLENSIALFGTILLTSEHILTISLDHDRKINSPVQKMLVVLQLCKLRLWLLGSHWLLKASFSLYFSSSFDRGMFFLIYLLLKKKKVLITQILCAEESPCQKV